MDSRRINILCIFNRLLGNKEYSGKIRDALLRLDNVNPTFWTFDIEDYSVDYKLPRIYEYSAVLEAAMRTRYKYREYLPEIEEKFDILYFVSYWLPLGFSSFIKKMPTVVALDSTPVLSHDLLQPLLKTRQEKIRSFVGKYVTLKVFRRIFKHVDCFLPFSQWCADSLENDFNISGSKIQTLYYPIDLTIWIPVNRHHGEAGDGDRFKLLFVGNDFLKKGREFLIHLFNEHLSGFCDLEIVSNDPWFNNKSLPSGITVTSGITHRQINKLIVIYQNADVFVFPTRKDQLGQVIIEAMATGLPVIASDVGAIKEFIINNRSGYLMAYHSSTQEWADKISGLAAEPVTIQKLRNESRRLIEEKCSFENFHRTIEGVIHATCRRSGP